MTTPPALRRNGEFRTGRGRRMEGAALVDPGGESAGRDELHLPQAER